VTSTPLSDEDRSNLGRAARLVAEAGDATSTAREAQTALWRRLVASGVSQMDIAEASGCSKVAVHYRVRPNEGTE